MKRILTALLALLLVLLSVACGKKSGDDPEVFTPSLDRETACTITVVGHYDNFEALEKEFDRFGEYYPNVVLKYEKKDNYNKIISTVLKEENPDIFFSFPWMIESEENRALFECAEDLTDPALGIYLSCIRDGLLNKDADGKITQVPIYTTTYGMLINEKIFEAANLSVPKTYDELIDVCGKLKDAGYANPIMGYNKNTSMLYSLFFPYFCGTISENREAVRALNETPGSAGEYARGALNLIADFMGRGFVNLENCNQIADDYNAVIKRFFEGDVPIMLASGSTVSGTEKREKQSDAFTANPFKYSFHPVPSTAEGGYFLNTISLSFSVNKNSENLDVANEFMRFLVRTSELNQMALSKRMVTPCKDMKLDEIYRAFGEVGEKRTIYMYDLGLADAPDKQVRLAGAQVTNGTMTVDEAVRAFGTLK